MNSLKQLDFVIETHCVVYPIGTDFQLLSNFGFQRDKRGLGYKDGWRRGQLNAFVLVYDSMKG